MMLLLGGGPIVRDDAMDVPLPEEGKLVACSGLSRLGASALVTVIPRELFRRDLVRSMDPIRTEYSVCLSLLSQDTACLCQRLCQNDKAKPESALLAPV